MKKGLRPLYGEFLNVENTTLQKLSVLSKIHSDAKGEKMLSESKQDLKAAALDARIELGRDEEEELQAKVGRITDRISVLKKEIDTAAEPPLFFPHEVECTMMEDKLEESLPRETALANGPDTGFTSFSVPRIVAEE